ncbi:Importin subunit beta-1 [Trichinella spiralis]|uniref:Importin subunit beta-1 n=2 Tax=Trichinella spiralis TaxID=6334 RepID=A0A0V1B825_TRISP|nr:Importin subunit beta-1 [Trichinella spiralis]
MFKLYAIGHCLKCVHMVGHLKSCSTVSNHFALGVPSGWCLCSWIVIVFYKEMSTDQLREALIKTISQNPNDLSAAFEYLHSCSEANLGSFAKNLSELLTNASEQAFIRQAAGLQLKNVLIAKDVNVRSERLQKWESIPIEVRTAVKLNVLNSLGTETVRPSIAAQCVASIAYAEFPMNHWPECIPKLATNVTAADSSENTKSSSLESLGYICSDLNPTVLRPFADQILTAIIHGMQKNEKSEYVRLVATNALSDSLEFIATNFEREFTTYFCEKLLTISILLFQTFLSACCTRCNLSAMDCVRLTTERNVIMQVICETTQSANESLKVAALQCLVKVMSLYYQHMEYYMPAALFSISVEAMKSSNQDVALQGIEFWSNVCDEELALASDEEEAKEKGKTLEVVCRNYAKQALPYVMPILLETLARQVDNDDDDEWVPAKAAGVCIMLLAQCVGDDIVAHAMPFITKNIASTDWHFRDASVMAFVIACIQLLTCFFAIGSILDGPNVKILKPAVAQALPFLLTLTKDPETAVRDTTAWCIGRICDLVKEVVVEESMLASLLPALIEALQQEPRVASNICWALSSLTSAVYEVSLQQTPHGEQPATYVLSPCFAGLVEQLLQTADRTDAYQSNLRIAAYESLMSLIKDSPKDCYTVVQNTLLVILKRLNDLLQMEPNLQSANERSQFYDIEGLLCAMLMTVVRRMTAQDLQRIADPIMNCLLQIMKNSCEREGGGAMEDALLASASFAEGDDVDLLGHVSGLGDSFQKYMTMFFPYVLIALKNREEYQVCSAAVGVCDDLSRVLKDRFAPYVPELMQLLYEILADASVEKSVKPNVLSLFGDIAMALENNFNPYLNLVTQALASALNTEMNEDDYYQMEYVLNLRENCIVAFTGLLHGLKGNRESLDFLRPFVLQFINNADKLILCEFASEEMLTSFCGMVGDVITVYGTTILPNLNQRVLSEVLGRGRRVKKVKSRSVAVWATEELKKNTDNVKKKERFEHQ